MSIFLKFLTLIYKIIAYLHYRSTWILIMNKDTIKLNIYFFAFMSYMLISSHILIRLLIQHYYFINTRCELMTHYHGYNYSKTSFIGTLLKCKHLVYRDLEGLPTTTYSLMVGCHDSCCMLTLRGYSSLELQILGVF